MDPEHERLARLAEVVPRRDRDPIGPLGAGLGGASDLAVPGEGRDNEPHPPADSPSRPTVGAVPTAATTVETHVADPYPSARHGPGRDLGTQATWRSRTLRRGRLTATARG